MVETNSNIALQLTGSGAAAIAVVRIVGPGVKPFLASHFSREARAARPVHGTLLQGSEAIDDAVVVMVRDDVADLNLHGGPWIVRRTLDLLASERFRIEENVEMPVSPPGFIEFADEIEREVLTHLPMARTPLALRWLLAQRELFQSPRFISSKTRKRSVNALVHLLWPPRVAIVGLPNVGKSTIANHLYSRERSIVADHPGTTRDWVGELADLEGLLVMLVDTPGEHETTDEIERAAIANSRRVVSEAELVVLVLDATLLDSPSQRAMISKYPSALRVLNKVDQLPEQFALRADVDQCTSAASGKGMIELACAIRSRFIPAWMRSPRACCWTQRQREQVYHAMPKIRARS